MVKTLKKYTTKYLSDDLLKHLDQYPYVFNPSIVSHLGCSLMTIRVYDTDTKTIHAHLYTWKEKESFNLLNLTEYFTTITNVKKVADPKLFIMNGDVWGTFNTGYVHKGENKVVLFQIKNAQISTYYYCNYNERSRIEKNWAFFMKDNCIYALYGLKSGYVLKASLKTLEEGDSLSFVLNRAGVNKHFKGYTIGTQLLSLGDHNYGLIGHKKIEFKGKRIYFGRAFIFTPFEEISIKKSSPFFVHSLKSLLGNSFKFNKNLISCTYFSGITMRGDDVIISYGINDIDWNIIALKLNKLWE